jgi:hypothetical protein
VTPRPHAAAFLLLAACAAAPRGEAGWSFPAAFTATQVVDVQSPRGSQALLASVWRAPGRFEIAFLDPALQVPLVVATLEEGRFVEQRLVPFPLASSDVEDLLRDVDALYAARGWRPDGAVWTDQVGRWTVEIDRPAGPDGCSFPQHIEMHPAGASLPRIEVRTLDVRCGTR